MGLARKRARIAGPPKAPKGGSTSAASAQEGAAPGAGRGSPGGKKTLNPAQILRDLQTDEVLTGKELLRAARALTALEIRPQVRGYSLLAKQLHNERETEAKGLGALGTRLQGEVSDTYRNLAASEAKNIANQQALAGQLNQATSQIAQQAQQGLAQMQEGTLGDLTSQMQIRGAPGGGQAQQELANVVASQQQAQAANSEASRNFAAQQGAGYAGLQAGMAGAAQMQGASAVGGIGNSVLGRIAQSNREYGQSIQEARSKLAEVKATKGATLTKNLLELRGGEQKYELGKAAVEGDKAKLRLEQKEAAEAKKQREIENSQWAKEFGLAKYEATHSDPEDIAKKRQEVKGEVKEARSMLASLIGAEGAPKNKQQLNALIVALNSKASADSTIVRKVALRWWEKRKKAMTEGNRGSLEPGEKPVPYAP